MPISTKLALAVAALAVTAGAVATSANAQVLENVRVRLPNGQVITVNDGNHWQQDTRIVEYRRYYYEPRQRVYVVYNDDHPPRGWKKYKHHDMPSHPAPHHGNGHGNGHGRH